MKKDKIKREYSLIEIFRLAYNLLKTKIICKDARLIRFPFVLRGGGYVSFGKRLTTGVGCRLEALRLDDDKRKRIVLGDDIQINDHVHISAMDKVEIGSGCLLASNIYISDNSHGYYKGTDLDSSPMVRPDHREYFTAPVTIKNNVWIGEGVMILPGVTIGEGSIIGAHSVVNKSIPDFSIAVGSPAKVVKKYNFETKRWERTK